MNYTEFLSKLTCEEIALLSLFAIDEDFLISCPQEIAEQYEIKLNDWLTTDRNSEKERYMIQKAKNILTENNLEKYSDCFSFDSFSEGENENNIVERKRHKGCVGSRVIRVFR